MNVGLLKWTVREVGITHTMGTGRHLGKRISQLIVPLVAGKRIRGLLQKRRHVEWWSDLGCPFPELSHVVSADQTPEEGRRQHAWLTRH